MRYLIHLAYPTLVCFVMFFIFYIGIDDQTGKLRELLKETRLQLGTTENYVKTLEQRINQLEKKYDIQGTGYGKNGNRQAVFISQNQHQDGK